MWLLVKFYLRLLLLYLASCPLWVLLGNYLRRITLKISFKFDNLLYMQPTHITNNHTCFLPHLQGFISQNCFCVQICSWIYNSSVCKILKIHLVSCIIGCEIHNFQVVCLFTLKSGRLFAKKTENIASKLIFTLICPFELASCNGVSSSSPLAFTLAPDFSKILTIL